jgi:Cu+-exporting ATPase
MGEPMPNQKKKAELKISGMHCATCAITVEESLSNIRDVSTVQVNFGTDTAHVEFDPAKVSLSEIEKAVKDAGYDIINREVTLKIGGMVCATRSDYRDCASGLRSYRRREFGTERHMSFSIGFLS